MIICEIDLDLSWSKNCIICQVFNTSEIDAYPAAAPPIGHAPAASTTSVLFQINSIQRYDLVVTVCK